MEPGLDPLGSGTPVDNDPEDPVGGVGMRLVEMIGPPGLEPVPYASVKAGVEFTDELPYGADVVIAAPLMVPGMVPLGSPVESTEALIMGIAVIEDPIKRVEEMSTGGLTLLLDG